MTRRPGAISIAALAGFLTACGGMLPTPAQGVAITDLDLTPRIVDVPLDGPPPAGPVVEIARGTVGGSAYRMTVYLQDDGLCIGSAWNSGEGLSCGALPGDTVTGHGVFGMTGIGGSDGAAQEASGVVRSDVDAVLITTGANSQVQAVLVSLEPAGIDGMAFFGFVPGGANIESIVAFDSGGQALESFRPGPLGR